MEKKKGGAKRRKNAKINENDEAVEESDEGDFDDRELDYISDSGRYKKFKYYRPFDALFVWIVLVLFCLLEVMSNVKARFLLNGENDHDTNFF